MPYTITDFISKEQDGTYKWCNDAVVINACHNDGVGEENTLLSRVLGNISRNGLNEELNIHSLNGMEITITFKQSIRDKYNDTEIRNTLIKWLNINCHNKLRYILIPEYGDNFNLHYHGVIWSINNTIKTAISNLKRDLRREFGFTYIRYIRNYDKYMIYINKEQKEEDKELMRLIIRYDF